MLEILPTMWKETFLEKTMKTKKQVFEAWAVVTSNGKLLWTDEEPCIYSTYNLARLNCGWDFVVPCCIELLKPRKGKKR